MARSRVTSLRSGYLSWPSLSLRCNLWTLPFRRSRKCVRAFAFVPFINQFWPSQGSFNPSLLVSFFAEGAASLLCLLWRRNSLLVSPGDRQQQTPPSSSISKDRASYPQLSIHRLQLGRCTSRTRTGLLQCFPSHASLTALPDSMKMMFGSASHYSIYII
jgi:hypothetical protein